MGSLELRGVRLGRTSIVAEAFAQVQQVRISRGMWMSCGGKASLTILVSPLWIFLTIFLYIHQIGAHRTSPTFNHDTLPNNQTGVARFYPCPVRFGLHHPHTSVSSSYLVPRRVLTLAISNFYTFTVPSKRERSTQVIVYLHGVQADRR